MKKLKKLGFSEHSDMSLYRTGVFYEVHVDVYSDSKYNLFSRIIEKNVKYIKQDNRLTILNQNNDIIIDISVDSITNVVAKSYSETFHEIVFSMNDIRYRMLICGGEDFEVICA